MTMTYEFGDGFGRVGELARFWFGKYLCCEVCTTICGMGCETVTPWNESLKFLAGVKKSIAVFWGEEALERYLFGKWKDCWRSGFYGTGFVAASLK